MLRVACCLLLVARWTLLILELSFVGGSSAVDCTCAFICGLVACLRDQRQDGIENTPRLRGDDLRARVD